MKSKKTILLILIIVLSLIPEVRAITPQSQTVRITDTHDDAFITEAGIGIDSSLVTILDPDMDIRSYLVFRELEINFWEPLKNATLRLHTSTILPFDADSSITIYGMALSDLQLEGFLLPSTVLSLGFTEAYTNYNTSEFDGQQWHEINVTSIVEELIRNPRWDGDGAAGTETGDAIGFHILGDEGDDRRYFYDYSVGNGLEAQLILHWNHEPAPPAGEPTAEFNETYRGFHIWSIDPILDPVRTGDGCDVNWNLVNLTQLTKKDSGACFNVINATHGTGASARKSYTLSLYNDTGAAAINTFFMRWKINMTAVWTSLVQDDPIPFFFALSTETPESGNGMSYGVAGEWIGLIAVTEKDDNRWAVYIKERNGLADAITDKSDWFEVSQNVMLYFEAYINMTTPIISYRIFNDPEFTSVNTSKAQTPVWAVGPFRYAQFLAGMGQATTGYDSFEVYSYLESPVDLGETVWTFTDENGTRYENCTSYECILEEIEAVLGADPEDPDPPGEGWDETGPFTRFRTRLYILLMGFGLLFGPLFYFAMRRPSGYELVIGLFIMLVGISFMIAAGAV